jgi:hypothetical protein
MKKVFLSIIMFAMALVTFQCTQKEVINPEKGSGINNSSQIQTHGSFEAFIVPDDCAEGSSPASLVDIIPEGFEQVGSSTYRISIPSNYKPNLGVSYTWIDVDGNGGNGTQIDVQVYKNDINDGQSPRVYALAGSVLIKPSKGDAYPNTGFIQIARENSNGGQFDNRVTSVVAENHKLFIIGTVRNNSNQRTTNVVWTIAFCRGEAGSSGFGLKKMSGSEIGGFLYRAVQGHGTQTKRIVVERNINLTKALFGFTDFDNNVSGDGWAMVGRTNGDGGNGDLQGFIVVGTLDITAINSLVPYVSIYQTGVRGNRCIITSPYDASLRSNGLRQVAIGQTRLMEPVLYVTPWTKTETTPCGVSIITDWLNN